MKTIGVIPARGGSKGIPKKNIKLLHGKPLIAYTIEAAKQSNLDEVVVSSDDDEILKISAEYGATCIKRPAELAEDSTPTLPVLQHAISEVGGAFDIVATLQPTSPLRTANHINEALNLFSREDSADSLVSIVKVPHNMVPASLMDMSGGFLRSYINNSNQVLRRQDKEILYARNGAAIYLTNIKCLESYIFGGNILPYEMNKIDSIDLDDMEDWYLVEKVMSNA